MSIVCSIFGHSPSSRTIWNDGYHFSTCSRCRADIVESDRKRWLTPPRGYQVVWKRRTFAPGAVRAVQSEPLASPASPLKEKRGGPDRRKNSNNPLPAWLEGRDRRRAERRKASGEYRASRRRGLLAQGEPES